MPGAVSRPNWTSTCCFNQRFRDYFDKVLFGCPRLLRWAQKRQKIYEVPLDTAKTLNNMQNTTENTDHTFTFLWQPHFGFVRVVWCCTFMMDWSRLPPTGNTWSDAFYFLQKSQVPNVKANVQHFWRIGILSSLKLLDMHVLLWLWNKYIVTRWYIIDNNDNNGDCRREGKAEEIWWLTLESWTGALVGREQDQASTWGAPRQACLNIETSVQDRMAKVEDLGSPFPPSTLKIHFWASRLS